MLLVSDSSVTHHRSGLKVKVAAQPCRLDPRRRDHAFGSNLARQRGEGHSPGELRLVNHPLPYLPQALGAAGLERAGPERRVDEPPCLRRYVWEWF